MGVAVSFGTLGLGTAPLGGLYAAVDDATAMATLQTAADVGITHLDTAPHYGRGLAESRIGAFLATVDRPERFTVSTKVGRRIEATGHRENGDLFTGAPPGRSIFDFDPRAIRDGLEASRERLGRDELDLVLLHDPDEHLDEIHAAADELRTQQADGRIGAIGVGTNHAETAHAVLDRIPVDVVLLAGRITLLEHIGETVARRCADEGIPLLAGGVLQSGILAGDGSDTYDYAPAPEPIRRRVAELDRLCRSHGVPLQHAAVAHPLRVTGVTTVVVGARRPDEVTAAADALDRPIQKEVWADLDARRGEIAPAS